jgi:hypothetical protein
MCCVRRANAWRVRRGALASSRGNRAIGAPQFESTIGSRWYCRHQHALSRYFRLSTVSNRCVKPRFGIRDSAEGDARASNSKSPIPNPGLSYNGQRLGAFAPSLGGRLKPVEPAQRRREADYLSST